MNAKLLCIVVALAVGLRSVAAEADSLRCTERRPDAASIATEAVAGLAINAGLTELLKHSVHEWRPNQQDDRSFPSRHTSWAFAASTILADQFYATQPWVPLVAQAGATAVGLQRIYGEHHYGIDVAGGMALGIGSAELGRVLSRLIFGRMALPPGGEAAFRYQLLVSSELLLPLGNDFRSGYGGSLRLRVPLSADFGVGVSAGAFGLCRERVEAVEGGDLLAGATWVKPVSRSWALTADAMAGTAYLRRWSRSFAFAADARIGAQWFLTDRFSSSLSVGYAYFGSLKANCLAVALASCLSF